MNRKGLRLISALVVAVILAGLCICRERPLYRSRDTVVEVYFNGEPVTAETFSVALVPERTYIHIPVLTNSIYDWFGVNWQQGIVGAALRPYQRIPGVRTVSKAGPVGIELLNPKIEDRWNLVVGANRMSFSNATLQVRIVRR